MNGAPIDEPLAGHGPFVMNTPREIQQAFADLHHGRLGKIPELVR
jgi:redox-sensitive bicupin YhaK (pirin superfamily)